MGVCMGKMCEGKIGVEILKVLATD